MLGQIPVRPPSHGRGAFVAGLVLGAVAGATIALICSPRPGKANRELLMEKVPGLKEDGPALLERTMAEIQSRLDEGRAAYQQSSSETRARMQRELDASQGGPPDLR